MGYSGLPGYSPLFLIWANAFSTCLKCSNAVPRSWALLSFMRSWSHPGFLYTVPFKHFIALVAQQNEEGRKEGKEGEFGERD